MPKYLFTSDQRISTLDSLIKKVAVEITSGRGLSIFTDKSDNNNATTLRSYYNLYEGTDVCAKAAIDPQFAIRNFVLKFQFPNTRTPESFSDSIKEYTLLAPFRVVVKTLVNMAVRSEDRSSYISFDEILYYIFCNPLVYRSKCVDYNQLISRIQNGRSAGIALESRIKKKIEWKQYGRQIGELMQVLNYASKAFEVSKRQVSFNLNSADYQRDKDFIDSILEFKYIWYPSNSNDFQLSTQEYISFMDTVHASFNVVDVTTPPIIQPDPNDQDKRVGYNKIFYGAPGTGKSHTVDEEYIKGHKSFRITFHPDTDYACFVGCYKPSMGGTNDDQITYAFVPQVFLNAYEYAWNHPGEKTYLVIEELNRGNCAQIFGDVFQLLDRRVKDFPGFSKYNINADSDIARYLSKHINNADGSYERKIMDLYDLDEFDFSQMALPDNLYILATMNTSDQSLFPIDSAFKRRWEWEYIDVNYEDAAQFELRIDKDHIYNWSQVLHGLNNYIKGEKKSTNKILGNRFVHAGADNVIYAKAFRDKVLFFLFNDVFRDDDEFKKAFFGDDAEGKFFEDLCIASDTELTIRFIETICGAKNIAKNDSSVVEDSGENSKEKSEDTPEAKPEESMEEKPEEAAE